MASLRPGPLSMLMLLYNRGVHTKNLVICLRYLGNYNFSNNMNITILNNWFWDRITNIGTISIGDRDSSNMITKIEIDDLYWETMNKVSYFQANVSQNPTKGGVAFSGFSAVFPPPLVTGLSSKCHNFFSIWCLLSLEKYVRQKYSLCLFSKKKFELVYLFPTILPSFFKTLSIFCQKLRILMGNRQTKKKFLNVKFECFRCFFIRWLY